MVLWVSSCTSKLWSCIYVRITDQWIPLGYQLRNADVRSQCGLSYVKRFPVMKWKTSSVSNMLETLSIGMIFSHATVHILLTGISKSHVNILKNITRPNFSFRSQIRPHIGLESAEFAVAPRTVKSIDALDFHMTHRITPHNCVLKIQNDTSNIVHCSSHATRGQSWADAKVLYPSWHAPSPP